MPKITAKKQGMAHVTLRQHNSMVVLQWHHLEAKMVVGLISYQIQGLAAQLKKKHYQTVEQAKLKTVKLKSTSLILSINTWLNRY